MSYKLAVLTGVAALALGGCGGDDGDEKKKSPTTGGGATKTSAETEGRFQADDVGFTFDYPTSFKQEDEPNDGSVLATVTPTPGDVKNGLKIRKTSDRELPFDSYAGQIRSQFEEQLDTKVEQKTGTRGSLELGVLQWKTADLASKSYFFIGGGKTWQLECLSTEEHFPEIAEACKQALGSIEFTEG